MRTLSKITISALALSMGLAGWAVHEQRQKNKLEKNRQKIEQEAMKAAKVKDASKKRPQPNSR